MGLFGVALRGVYQNTDYQFLFIGKRILFTSTIFKSTTVYNLLWAEDDRTDILQRKV